LTLTMAEGDRICEVTRETGKVLQVGTQQRCEFGEIFLKAAAICRSGRLGGNLHALSSVGQPDSAMKPEQERGPFPEETIPEGLWSWDFWLGQAPLVPFCKERWNYDFRWWFAYSGGQVTDWGVHHTDIAAWALGVDDQLPVSVEGTGELPSVEGGYDVATSFDVTAKYANGCEIRLTSGINELILSGDRGRIRVNRGGLTGKPVEELTEKDNEELAVIMRELMHGKQGGDHMRNFFECMADGSLPVANVYSHVNTVNVCHMANICLRTGRPLQWDPQKREFVADAQATAMMDREQRRGFEVT
ncbi:MAG: hypothetical protein Q4C47_09490, partial [Planctomycetia bacterium]|nr:hypothetical protein [Planctomycetia bacterium]